MKKFKPAPIFSDYMVLQRGKNIAIFGTGENGVEITGELGGFKTSSVVRDGKWQLVFPPMGAARYMQLELYDSTEEEYVCFKNVAVGEVWLVCGTYAAELACGEEPEKETADGDVRFFCANSWKSLNEKENTACRAFAEMIAKTQDSAAGIVAVDDESGVAPYTINGAIYYRDSVNNLVTEQHYFYELMRNLLKTRELWHNDSLPIVIGQLPLKSGDTEAASVIREAQMRAYQNLKNMGIAVLLDCENDSVTAGERFAAQALHLVYGGYDGAFSPMISGAIWRGDTVELHFEHAPFGFKADKDVNGFEICGDDGIYVPAIADISGEKIFLSSDEVPNPRGARYLWNKSSENLVRNNFGLPLSPFRIDNV